MENKNIVELNKDMECFVIQGSETRPAVFKEKFKPLQFVHFSDVHKVMDLWNRIADYINYYKDYISFAIHTGDYCGNNQQQYADMYNYGKHCERTIFNCVGNHDTVVTRKWERNTKESTYNLLFSTAPDECFDVTFMEGDFSMTYYKDFEASGIRMIVLDLYYDIDQQKEWLKSVLSDAKTKCLTVITAMHEPTSEIKESYGVTFNTYNDYSALSHQKTQPFEEEIVEFMNDGGDYACNLCGHCHFDLFGHTENGVLNVAVESATNWDSWCDGTRDIGTRTYDSFNVVSVDKNLGLLKLCRIGNHTDHYLREKKILCFDYRNKKVIAN